MNGLNEKAFNQRRHPDMQKKIHNDENSINIKYVAKPKIVAIRLLNFSEFIPGRDSMNAWYVERPFIHVRYLSFHQVIHSGENKF